MIYTNVDLKLPGKEYKQATIAAMSGLIHKAPGAIYLDTETMARNFDSESLQNAFIEAYIARTGRQPTAKTLASSRSYTEQQRGEMALDCRRSEVRLIQIAAGDDIFVVDSIRVDERRKSQKLSMQDPLQKIFEAIQGKPVCGHNLKFDLKMLFTRWPDYKPSGIWDTMIGHKLTRSARVVGFFHSTLADVVRYWCHVELQKGHGTDDWSKPITKEQFDYSVLDVKYLNDIAQQQIAVLNNESVDKESTGYFDGTVMDKVTTIEMKFVEVLAWTEIYGMPLNVKPLEERAKKFKVELAKLKKPFDKLKVNTQSPLQLMKFLETQGVDVIGTAKDELTKYVHIPIVEQLMKVKTVQKELQMIEDYCHEWLRDNGRVYTNFSQMRATDGRMSSFDFNAQQIPRAIKKIFYGTSKKTCIIKADYPAIEARLMGIIAPDENIKIIFKEGRDMHRVSASDFLNKPEEEITELERRKVKAANFGFMFGMGALTFIRYAFTNYGLVVSLDEATITRQKYFQLYPGVKRFHNINSAKLADSREITVHTLLGRRMRVDGFTNANNYPVQGSAVDMIKLASILFFNEVRKKKLDAKLINIVHDELVVEASRKDKDVVSAILSSAMNRAADYIIMEFGTKVEVEII